MVITDYTPNKCRYSRLSLKKHIYLLSGGTKSIKIDNGEAYISSVSQIPVKVDCSEIQVTEEAAYNDRFKFVKSVQITVDGYLNNKDLPTNPYVIIENEDGDLFLVNVDFPARVTYSYTLSDGVNQTEITFASDSNFPTLKLNGIISNSYECKIYDLTKINKIWGWNADKTRLSTANNTLYADEQPVFVEALDNSYSLTEEFDGNNYNINLSFNIPLSNYKSSWHYNLMEYQNNVYRAILLLKNSDYKAYLGYFDGLIPSYRINGDIITVTLTGYGNYALIFSNEIAPIPIYRYEATEITTCVEISTKTITYTASSKLNVELSAFTPAATAETYNSSTSAGTIEFAEDVNTIGDFAFNNKADLISIIIPNSVISIGDFAFINCTGLSNITIPDSVIIIGAYAFIGCTFITSVSIGNRVTSIGSHAFNYCSYLTNINIPSGVTEIKENTFSHCGNLKSFEIPNNITSIKYQAFAYCYALSSVTIPDSVTYIGEDAFRYCENLTSVTIPNSVSAMEQCTFADSSGLTSAVIGSGMTNMYDMTFMNCTNLTSATFLATTPPIIYWGTFYNTSSNLVIYVPAESVNAYKTGQYLWSDYADRIQAIP